MTKKPKAHQDQVTGSVQQLRPRGVEGDLDGVAVDIRPEPIVQVGWTWDADLYAPGTNNPMILDTGAVIRVGEKMFEVVVAGHAPSPKTVLKRLPDATPLSANL